MDIEKSIDTLEIMLLKSRARELIVAKVLNRQQYSSMEDALQALKKQTPKETLFHIKNFNDRDFYITQCPTCKYNLSEITTYCSNCGQRLTD